jgi:polyvinyl alcohol dehydrogenase (cytochrome)
VYALDRATGATIWSTLVDDTPLTHLWSSPMVADGVLIVGLSADATQSNRQALPQSVIDTFRGAVVGLDAVTGEIIWRLETTRPAGQPDVYGAGVSVWGSAAIDREREAAFMGTGNGFATPVSPYSDALLAIRYQTGEVAWAHQFTANDAYSSGSPSRGPDSDVGATPNLFTIDDGGIPRDVVGVGDKAGVYHVLDRDSGEVVWERVLAAVPFSRKTGGVIAPAAYAEGMVLVASNTGAGSSRVWALDARDGTTVWESASVGSVNFGAPAVANGVLFFGGSGFSVGGPVASGLGVSPPGQLIAFDLLTGAELLRTTLSAGRGGGFSISEGHVLIGTGFTFFAWSDEPLNGALQVFEVP